MRCALLVVGQHNGAVAAHEHTLDGACKVIGGAIVAGEFQFDRGFHITGQFGLGIILEQVGRYLIVYGLQQGNSIACLVGLNNDLTGGCRDKFLPLVVNSGLGIFSQGFITFGFNGQRVVARFYVLKHEHTVVILIGGVTSYFLSFLVQDDHGTVDGSPLVHRGGVILIQVVDQVFMHVLDRSHDVALVLRREAEILAYTTGNADALLMAVVAVQSTVACRLIGVEITLNQETGSTMLEHTQVTFVSYACVWVNTGR